MDYLCIHYKVTFTAYLGKGGPSDKGFDQKKVSGRQHYCGVPIHTTKGKPDVICLQLIFFCGLLKYNFFSPISHSVRECRILSLTFVIGSVSVGLGLQSEGHHGQIFIQCSVWVDHPSHQPCYAQQTRHGRICLCKSMKLKCSLVLLN